MLVCVAWVSKLSGSVGVSALGRLVLFLGGGWVCLVERLIAILPCCSDCLFRPGQICFLALMPTLHSCSMFSLDLVPAFRTNQVVPQCQIIASSGERLVGLGCFFCSLFVGLMRLSLLVCREFMC